MGILNSVKCALIEVMNVFIEHVLNNVLAAIGAIVGLLPSLPLPDVRLEWGQFGSAIGYFLPVGTMIGHFALMVALVGVWYSYEYIMRLLRMIK